MTSVLATRSLDDFKNVSEDGWRYKPEGSYLPPVGASRKRSLSSLLQQKCAGAGSGAMSTVYCEVEVGKSREGLRLSLNRSLSEPGPAAAAPLPAAAAPAKRCKVDCFSLPASPCSESATLQKALLAKCVRLFEPETLAGRLGLGQVKSRSLLVVDCRPFLAYNVNHIRGSINVNCSDRFNRRRLQQGKATLADLATTREGKDLLKKRTIKEVVVYDDSTSDLERLPPNHPLFLVLSSLVEDNREPAILLGGHKEFVKKHKEFCEDALLPPGDPASSPSASSRCQWEILGSPTTAAALDSRCASDIESHPASRVLPHLYLGNQRDAENLDVLRNLGISRVLNVTSELPGYHEERGILYKHLPAADSSHQNLKQYFEEAFHFIEEARQSGGSVLVHCQAGISRSPTIAIAYMMKHRRLSLIEAYKEVKNARTIISPNFNFMGQLFELEQSLKATPVSSDSQSDSCTPAPAPCHPCRWSPQANEEVSSGCSV
nr:PREDICTED: dual specificity protein phosphatase 10-like isoform X2 [Bemisia tabaci]